MLGESSPIMEAVDAVYALYVYNPNRPHRNSLEEISNVTQYLDNEATADDNFSLSQIATNLDAENENELRGFIAKRLSKGAVYAGSSNVAAMEFTMGAHNLPAVCFFYLIRQPNTVGKETDNENSFYHQEYMVCYLTTTTGILDLYRQELGRFSDSLLALLDAQDGSMNTKIDEYLSGWYDAAVCYTVRCLDHLGADIACLVQAALSDDIVQYDNVPAAVQAGFEDFIRCCSLSELLNHGETRPAAERVPCSRRRTLRITCADGKYRVDAYSTNKYCTKWAEAMLTSAQGTGSGFDASLIKQVIESYKLRTIQDMNVLKRLLRQSETDLCATYRAYLFLQQCGNGEVLLRHARQEGNVIGSHDTQAVIRVLEEYIQEKGGLYR